MLAATIIGFSMTFIDGTVVNVALAALREMLDASLTEVQWIVEAYMLFLASVILVGGALGESMGAAVRVRRWALAGAVSVRLLVEPGTEPRRARAVSA